MSDELKKFIDERFEALRLDTSKAFELARQKLQDTHTDSKLNSQTKAV
jgi:hypothetical protein